MVVHCGVAGAAVCLTVAAINGSSAVLACASSCSLCCLAIAWWPVEVQELSHPSSLAVLLSPV